MPLQPRSDPEREFAPAMTYRLTWERRRKLEWLVTKLRFRSMTALVDALIDQEYEAQGGEQSESRQTEGEGSETE